MKTYENKEVTTIKMVLKSVKCDACKKDISKTDHDFYYEATTSHSCWGNDSNESFEYFDFCSWECLLEHMSKYYAHADNTYRYEVEQVGK